VHLGYARNDIAFLRNLQDSGIKFKFLFSIYPGLETELLVKNVGTKGLHGVFTYVPASETSYVTNFGMDLAEYKRAWHTKYADSAVEFGFNSVAGYTTGLVIEKTLVAAQTLDQLALGKAVFSLSGELKTLDGIFTLDANGAQIGEITPIGQLLVESGQVKFVTVYPHELATGKPIYPRP
jgi:branched-chain amino acid transport system substrate-binding protein